MSQQNESLINLVFDPGKGSAEFRSVDVSPSQPLRKMPGASLDGYTFDGWYTAPKGGRKISPEDIPTFTDNVILYAHYTKKQSAAGRKSGKKSLLRRQKLAILILLVAVALLIAAYFVVQYIVSIYVFDDTDGTRYYIKKNEKKVYCLYDGDGALMPQNSDGYYITAIDTQVSVDEKTGSHQIYAVVDTEDGEVVGASQRIMMYKQLTYDQSSSTAIADASRIIQSIVVNNTSGSFGFSRSVSLYDSKQNYFLNYRNGAYRLCDSDFEPLTEENGAYALKDGKLTLTLDPVTGRYRVSNADASFTIATGTTLSYGTDENGREIEKAQYNITFTDGTKTYYLFATYTSGTGAVYQLYTRTGNTYSACQPSSESTSAALLYRLPHAVLTVSLTTGGAFEVVGDNDAFAFGNLNGIGDFVINEHETASYNKELFATLAVACGYTISMDKLKPIPAGTDLDAYYREYGLTEEIRTDSEGNAYTYKPAEFTVTAATGDTYTVYIGDPIVSEAGYYVRTSTRDAVYILSSNGISTTLLVPVESLVTGQIVYPMSISNYFNVEDFILIRDIDYEAIAKDLLERHPDITADEVTDEMWEELVNAHSKTVCHFSYLDLAKRENTMNSGNTYEVKTSYMRGYSANETNINAMLQSLYSMTFTRVCKLGPVSGNTDLGEVNDFDTYDLTYPAFTIRYNYQINESDGSTTVIGNYVEFSHKTKDNTYYAYAPEYDMIVEIPESSLLFLEWGDFDWYQHDIFDINISYVTDLILSAPSFRSHFELNNYGTSQAAYLGTSLPYTETLDDGTKITYTVEETASGYVLRADSAEHAPTVIHERKYLVAAQNLKFTAYSAPAANGRPNVILSENNSDKDAGTTTYYYYYVTKANGSYNLAALVGTSDQNGNLISSNDVAAEPAYSTDYYLTEDGTLYLMSKSSPAVVQVPGNGTWHRGGVFYTAKNAYLLVDYDTGASAKLSGLTQKLYFYQTDIPAGTVGIRHTGIQYRTAGGRNLLLDTETGELGFMSLSNVGSSSMTIRANGNLLDYTLEQTESTGSKKTVTAVDNFRNFYKALLYASIEGEADITEEEALAFRNSPDSACQLILTVYAEDLVGNTRYLRYRFYRYSERHSYMTIEVLDSPDDTSSSPQNGTGNFYVLTSFVNKIIADAQRTIDGELITPTGKY